MIAKFDFWKPKGLTVPQGVLVIVPPSQSDGRWEVKNEDWRNFCTAHDLALVGCFFQDAQPGWIEDYCNVRDSASGFRLIEFIKESLDLKGHIPPLYIWGFSAGGQFAYEFTVNFPKLVAAFVVNKGGVYWTALAPQPAREIPGLFCIGTTDAASRIYMLNGILLLNQRAGAKWVRAEEPISHMEGNSREVGREFFKDVIKAKEAEAAARLKE